MDTTVSFLYDILNDFYDVMERKTLAVCSAG